MASPSPTLLTLNLMNEMEHTFLNNCINLTNNHLNLAKKATLPSFNETQIDELVNLLRNPLNRPLGGQLSSLCGGKACLLPQRLPKDCQCVIGEEQVEVIALQL
ncbi:hypothetical protein Tco_1036652 [Tanacetum coccineum]